MSKRVLGLDLGPSSIGWALIDEEQQQVIAAGARVFPEGVDRDKQGGEKSKSESRRIARGMRRQIARRSRRKRRLREALVLCGLLPAEPGEQKSLDSLDPYELRKRGLDERLDPHEVGRLLIHLNQRRGFLSNRKGDKKKQKEDSDTLTEISQLAADIEADGHRTLGEHLAELYHNEPLQRVRKRHTRRDMYEAEFEAIWTKQSEYYPELLTDQLRFGESGKQAYPREPEYLGRGVAGMLEQVGIYGLIFFQRPMYWPKSVVGQCELNPKEKRCPRADRLAQRFRILVEVNNLRIISRGEILELSAEQRTAVLKELERKREVTFDDLRKKLKLLDSDGFNLEAGDRRKLKGMETDFLLAHKELFGKTWHDRPAAERNDIVQFLLSAEERDIQLRAENEWQFDSEQVHKVLSLNLPEGYASYGRETLRRLLPHVEAGLPLMTADGMPCAIKAAKFLLPFERRRDSKDALPQPPDVTNPLVRQALHEVRKVVNAVVREYGKPDAIHLELARDVKGSGVIRAKMTEEMRSRERTRDRVARILEEHGDKPTRGKIELYRLWEEQGKACIYSGREIGIRQLLGGEVNVDHILPYARSLDDSQMNKVVCFRSENDAKGDRTPHEWLAGKHPDKYEAVLQRASRLPIEIRNRKLPRFTQKSCELEDFINRNLTDTAYITAAVLDYLRWLGCDLVGGKGALTAELRHSWGLNTVLRDDHLNLKNREDHRHHAVDAIVIALTNRSRLQQLANARGRTELPTPWDGFRDDVEKVADAINVSHRTRRKVAGALHEETVYGPTTQDGMFVYRKGLEDLKLPMIEQIRDTTIRELVMARLRKFKIDLDSGATIPKEVWKDPLLMASGVVIKKVRILKRDETIRKLHDGQYVKPGSNHHVCIFEITETNGKKRREPVWVSTLDAIKRVQSGQNIIQRRHPTDPNAQFIMSFSRGEMLLAELKGVQRLVWFRTGASTQGQLYFVEHTDARPDRTVKKYVATANSLKARKVTVDPLGRIRWAND